ncbi:dihydrodipicolinate synthase family protein [Williamsia sp. CHRR-6]|uniref:dihydrodipicolinate synthase family protein n=1 Tax=Williamsia sp. CHRR-6 TaxID=2835871 RepID=UPI001BDA8143|nr:dihydrodipicolinate synthase family protein [Williamsia sp. CHRR-6]MBT0567076.1 dihydrodipicolinate synthase family protein [Williamsia sp. CHRR-6]
MTTAAPPRLVLPGPDGDLVEHQMTTPREFPRHRNPHTVRTVFAAAHVVPDPLSDTAPGAPAVLDWDATLAFRRHLFSHGMGVAEAMDTAQRNMGLDWACAAELISQTAQLAQEHEARVVAGAGTDHAPEARTLRDVTAAYVEQVQTVQATGAAVVVMASRQLAATATCATDYVQVYRDVLATADRPVILHWLGTVFDPQLHGYWGSDDVDVATQTFLGLCHDHADRIDGVKVSLLDADHEIRVRAALPDSVRLYTGDDFHYPELIRGDGTHVSHALLGAFAAVAPAASAALDALAAGDVAGYDREMASTLPLSRHIFSAPTPYYKTGIAFMAWLCGHQPRFSMVGGMATARSVSHLVDLFRLADEAGLLIDPDLAAHRMSLFLELNGVER